jgi:hypothetical protein
LAKSFLKGGGSGRDENRVAGERIFATRGMPIKPSLTLNYLIRNVSETWNLHGGNKITGDEKRSATCQSRPAPID